MPFEVPSTERWSTQSGESVDFPHTWTSQAVVVGFQRLHIEPVDSGTHFGVAFRSVRIADNQMSIGISTRGSTTLKECTANVLRWPPAYVAYQSGHINASSDGFTPGMAKWSYRVKFDRQFIEPPQVVTFFDEFEMSKDKPWRLTCKATDIDKSGFTVHVDAWGDTSLERVWVRWFAHPTDLRGVVSGDISIMDVFRSKGKLYWPNGAFSNNPRICFLALRSFNSESNPAGLNFGIDYSIEDDYVDLSITDQGRLEGASFSYVLME